MLQFASPSMQNLAAVLRKWLHCHIHALRYSFPMMITYGQITVTVSKRLSDEINFGSQMPFDHSKILHLMSYSDSPQT